MVAKRFSRGDNADERGAEIGKSTPIGRAGADLMPMAGHHRQNVTRIR